MALEIVGVSVLSLAGYLVMMGVGTDSREVDAVAVCNFLW